MPKICIVSDKHLHTNPRVWKEANSLANKGYEVVVITQFSSVKSKLEDEKLLNRIGARFNYIAGVDLSEEGSKNDILFYKTRRKLATIAKKALGKDSEYLITYAPEKISEVAFKENADLYIAHVEGGYCVGKRLLKAGKKVAFDQEDWFSRDYLVPERPVKLLSSLEKFALKSGAYVTCPSYSMAIALSEAYHAEKPEVIYNSFPREENYQQYVSEKPGLVWFSQTIGAGRGLERIIDTLKQIERPVQLLLIGNCSARYESTLKERMGLNSLHELRIHKPVTHHELHDILLQQDIGLALENNHPDNKDTTISNKMFQYLQAGLKVLATDTKGQAEVAKMFKDAVSLVGADDNEGWGDVLSKLLEVTISSEEVVAQYHNCFSWEEQEKKLLQLVEKALRA